MKLKVGAGRGMSKWDLEPSRIVDELITLHMSVSIMVDRLIREMREEGNFDNAIHVYSDLKTRVNEMKAIIEEFEILEQHLVE